MGIIPARAGFTTRIFGARIVVVDHPRSRGVYALIPFQTVWIPGSSPLARGLLDVIMSMDDDTRIIPARAGFTRDFSEEHGGVRDHPRSRGVYCFSCLIDDMGMGSSPLARGLRGAEVGARRESRIIPARAGFT